VLGEAASSVINEVSYASPVRVNPSNVWRAPSAGNYPGTEGGQVARSGIIWTVVGVLLIIALLIYIF
jgi:hypothetical protein